MNGACPGLYAPRRAVDAPRASTDGRVTCDDGWSAPAVSVCGARCPYRPSPGPARTARAGRGT